jgi:Mg-chelatase subunit ChlI
MTIIRGLTSLLPEVPVAVGQQVGAAPKQQELGGGGPWSLSYSPTCEHVALAPGGKRWVHNTSASTQV